jgi:lysozyme
MHISERGIRMIEGFEGFVDHQYDDGTGVMTIGYGTTRADVDPLPTTMTQAEAEQFLRRKLAEKYEPAVNALDVPLNQNQFDALVSLVYNCGIGAMQWQIGRDLRARNYPAAAEDFGRYVYAGGRVLQGLVNRRHAERALFLTPDSDSGADSQMPTNDPYAIFPDRTFRFVRGSLVNVPAVLSTFDGTVLELNERSTVHQYDRLMQNPAVHHKQIRRHELWLLVLRKRVWTVAHHPLGPEGKPTWDVASRGARWKELERRTADLV